MILTSWIELFVNFKRVELEPKKWFVSKSSWVSSRTNSYRLELSSDKFDSTRLIFSLVYIIHLIWTHPFYKFTVFFYYSKGSSLIFWNFWEINIKQTNSVYDNQWQGWRHKFKARGTEYNVMYSFLANMERNLNINFLNTKGI